MTNTITATENHRINEVTLVQGFSSFVIALDFHDGEFIVTACKIYNTAQGGRVGGVKERKFADRDEARKYANGYYFAMRNRGWKPAGR